MKRKYLPLLLVTLALALPGCQGCPIAAPPAPYPPSDLAGVAVSSSEVNLTWIDPSRVKVLQTRDMQGAGRGSPDAKIEIVDYTTLPDLPIELKEQIRTQCQKILDSLES